MDPRDAAIQEYVDNAVAEAVAGGKTKEEAEALRPGATEDAKKIVDHPLFKKFEGAARKRFAEHDDLKKEVGPLKTAAQKLKELEEKDLTDSQRLAKENEELKPTAARAKALEVRVQAILDDAIKGLTDAQRAVIVGDTPEAKLEHYQALAAAWMFGEQIAGRSPGGVMPAKGGANVLKGEDLVAGDDVGAFNANRAELKAGKKTLA